MVKTKDKLTIVERRIVQLMLRKKSAVFIAEIIGRPLGLVNDCIHDFVSKDIDRKSFDQQQMEKVEAREMKKAKRKSEKFARSKAKRIKKKIARRVQKVNDQLEASQRGRARATAQPYLKKAEKIFATRALDTTEKIAVRIDHKTIIYVDPGADIEAVKLKYKKRDPTFLKPEKPVKYVKKFKPVKDN